MKPIIYDVAVSMDGFISGADGDISQVASEGPVVEAYMARLAGYAVAIMGRGTYEFGYRFGMQPGQNPYGHMQTRVYSKSLELPDNSEVSVHSSCDAEAMQELKSRAEGPIYLCGGGAFAASLLAMGMIDLLRLKRAPILLGEGVRLFAGAAAPTGLRHISTQTYDGGYLLQDFALGD